MPLDPNKFPTFLDVAKLDKGSGYDVIQEAIYSHAELDLFPAATQTDTDLEITVMTELPDGDTFRRPNEGILPSKPKFSTKKFPMALVDRRVEIDKYGVEDKAKDKARLRVNLSVPQMNAALRDVAKQIIYGKVDDANKGFPGLVAQAANDAQHVVDATGAANLSSVWFLEIVPSAMELLFGQDQTITMGDEWDEETTLIADPAKPGELRRLRVSFNQIHGWVGLRLLNIHRAIQIKNIGTANGKTLTPLMMNTAMNKCQDDLGFRPTHILGNGRSFEQLRVSYATELLPDPPRLGDQWEASFARGLIAGYEPVIGKLKISDIDPATGQPPVLRIDPVKDINPKTGTGYVYARLSLTNDWFIEKIEPVCLPAPPDAGARKWKAYKLLAFLVRTPPGDASAALDAWQAVEHNLGWAAIQRRSSGDARHLFWATS